MLSAGVAALALAAGAFSARFDDPAFALVHGDTRWRGRPFTGVAYEPHRWNQLYRLAFFLGGRQVLKELHWYPSGARWIENDFAGGLPHGLFRMWFEDGKAQALARYDRGERHGESWGWHRSGRVTHYARYERGRELAFKTWTFDGKPYFNYVYQDGRKVGVQGGDFCKTRKSALN